MNYKKLGFKCGIEIHQQLEGKKLFCNCLTEIRKDKPDFEFDRKLRASAGESGKIDSAVSHEQQKGKLFTYCGYEDINCLVEMDEEPPHAVNPGALKTALQVANMLNCQIVDKIQFMRKTVVDGSNVSGFQRTAVIGMNGWINVNGKKIGILGVFLEEEACQVMNRTKDYDTYNLSRLGIPLLEIATAPDITTPEECKDSAAKIGMILRSTGACKRGIGSIRQDVNISIIGGARTEIKGFQDLKTIPKVIDHEINRQLKIIKQKKKVEKEVRKAEQDFKTTFLRPMSGAARMYPETDVTTIIPGEMKFEKIRTITEREKCYSKEYNLSSDLTKEIIKLEDTSNLSFESLVKSFKKIEPSFMASQLTQTTKDIRRKLGWEPSLSDFTEEIFPKLNAGEIASSSIVSILEKKAKGEKVNYDDYKILSDSELEKGIKEIVKKNKGAPMGALMGMIMRKFKGQVDGKKAMDILKKYL